VGVILMVIPAIPFETQLVFFAIASVVSVIAWRKYRETRPQTTDQPNLNRRGHQYIGRVFSLTEPITNGVGKVTVDDSTWKIKGPDLPAGTHVEVVGVEGVVFVVKSTEKP
jgi:membrane protein implicated in regulation of membrane protease activity